MRQTRQLYDGKDTFTEFSQWIRKLDYPLDSANYDCNNIDFQWVNYREGWFILIEEKRYGAYQKVNQHDSHMMIHQMLSSNPKQSIKTLRGVREIEYRGYYLIIFEQTSPVDSSWVIINSVKYTEPLAVVKRLLLTGTINNSNR